MPSASATSAVQIERSPCPDAEVSAGSLAGRAGVEKKPES